MYIERIQALNEKAVNDYRNKITEQPDFLKTTRKEEKLFWHFEFGQGDLVFLTPKSWTFFFKNKVKRSGRQI